MMPLTDGVAPRQHRRMADRRDGRVVLEVRVGEDRALGQQPLEPAGVLAAESRQVVVAELIDGDEQHQPDVGPGGRLRRQGERHGERENGQQKIAPSFFIAVLGSAGREPQADEITSYQAAPGPGPAKPGP